MNRRQHLKRIVSAFALFGVVFSAIPFIRSLKMGPWRAHDFDLEIDISKLTPEQPVIADWFGTPIAIFRRTNSELEELANINGNLSDPHSEASDQPLETVNTFRSIKPEIMVLVPLCTHLGCKVNQIEKGTPSMPKSWAGGFQCPCHGSNFDMAGRVYKHMPAPTNLKIPPHKYISENKILFSLTLLS